jgi:F0F1-type ATP synthase assembly protein I
MKKIIQRILIIGVIIIGIYMLVTNTWPTPPAVSGLGFLLAGLAMWVPHCPICKMLFKD